ncbi:hypothetical protein ABFY57_11935 [Paenibacillus polymyxa]|uniref:hypothetical protein n=1 Tax=Paenibacillus polymyxa TaxID=1406 RepID=UPI002018AB89|nr:hypothetical protein [Paenibacillus polymyxa]UQQ36155.1 hypothetical protein LMH85_04350 [Paenibacillus polymyxa]
MRDERFEVSISMYYKDIDWIAKPFKYYFDPLNTYSVIAQLEQFPSEKIDRIRLDLDDEKMSGKEIYKWLNEAKKKLIQSGVEGVVNIQFKAVLVDFPIY